MATRKPKDSAPSSNLAVKLFVKMAEFDSNPDKPLTLPELCDEMSLTVAEILGLTEILENAELIDGSGRGNEAKWWINVPDVSEDNAESIAREALSDVVTVVETPSQPQRKTKAEKDAEDRARLEYATRAAETQDEVMSQSPQVQQRDKALPAVTPERLPEIKGLDQFKDDETGDMVYESSIVKHGLVLDEPESVPSCPEGVNANVWDLAHTAITQSARDYWMRQVKAVIEAQNDPAPF